MNLQNPRLVLIGVFLLFLMPLVIAVMMRSSWWNFEPARLTNAGELIQQPLPLPVNQLDLQYSRSGKPDWQKRDWVLLYPFPGECNEHCRLNATSLRQIHLATGRHRNLVALWLLAPVFTTQDTQKELVTLYPEFTVLVDSNGAALQTLAQISGDKMSTEELWNSGQAFLLDHTANIILRYTPGFDPNDIKQDLDHLLTWSGKE